MNGSNLMATGAAPVLLVELLIEAAREAAVHLREKRDALARARIKPRRPSLTLRPGPDTPLWNELIRQIQPYLRRRGSKAQLARLLELPRQRLHDCLKAQSASLDAERTLVLVGWLGFFQRGGQLVPVVRGGRSRRNRKGPPHPGCL